MISILIKLFRFLGSACYTIANGLKLLKGKHFIWMI